MAQELKAWWLLVGWLVALGCLVEWFDGLFRCFLGVVNSFIFNYMNVCLHLGLYS